MQFTLTSVTAAGVYHGTIVGGAASYFAGFTFNVQGFSNAGNNGTFKCSASAVGTLTLTNPGAVAETSAATATIVVNSVALDPTGYPSTVVTAASATGVASSSIFAVQARQGGGPRNLWLQLGPTTGTVSAFVVELNVSWDSGATWQILQAGIDLVGSPSQQVSPPPPPGAILQLQVTTITGGGTASVIASSS